MTMSPEMMQMLMNFGMKALGGGKGAQQQGGGMGGLGSFLPMLQGMGGGGSALPGLGTPGINSDPRAQQALNSMRMPRPSGGGTQAGGSPIFPNVGASQGFSPEGANHNKFMQDMASGSGEAMAGGGGMDPKSKMMMMVAQQLFKDSNKKGEPLPQDVSVGANSINVGGMPTLDPGSFANQMQMQRGAPRQYGLGGGMLEDPRKRRGSSRFLFGG